MNLKQLHAFLAVLQHGTLNKASEKLNLSQPAISKIIQNLERDLGIKLLDRSARGMRPTVFGDALERHAKLIEATVQHARDELGQLKGLSRGRVAFGAVPSTAQGLAAGAISELIRRHPGVSVTMLEGFTEAITRSLLDGSVEFVIAPLLAEFPEQDVSARPLYKDHLAVICRAGHRLHAKRTVSIDDLHRAQWVFPPKPDHVTDFLVTQFIAAGLSAPVAVFQTNATSTMMAVVANSDALGFMPTLSIRGSTLPLTVLRNSPVQLERQIFVIKRRLGALTPLATALIKALQQAAARPATTGP